MKLEKLKIYHKNHFRNMEANFSLRFPKISEAIFQELDNETLVKCIQVGEEWNNLNYNTSNPAMILMKRKMQFEIELRTDFDEDWRKVIYEMSTTNIFALYNDMFLCFRGRPNNFKSSVTPLHWAASHGNLALYRVFFELVDNKNPIDDEGSRPIHVAATDGNLNIIREIVRNLQDINPTTDNGTTVLDLAVLEGHLKVVEYMLGLIGYSNLSIVALMHTAAEFGYVEIFKLLALNSIDKNPIKQDGITTLHVAAKYGHLQICKFIMKHLTDKLPRDDDDLTPLHYTAATGNVLVYKGISDEVMDKSPRDIDGETPLHIAAREGHIDLCMVIIEDIQDKNPRDIHGNTPLHLAAERGNLMLCEIITDEIDDKNPADNHGVTPMHV